MSELSETQIPSGGWQFFQPQTGWWAPTPLSSTLDQTSILVIKMRRANPAITIRHNLSLDFPTVKKEVKDFNRARLGLGPEMMTVPKLPPPAAQPQVSGAVSQAVAVVKKMAEGAALLMEWEETGLPPVIKEVSEKRAGICADCPKNDKGKSLTEIFTIPFSNLTKRRFEKLQQMNLTTTHDQELNVCQACLCPLRLKVHTPIELITKRLKPESRAELDPRCWILSGQ